MDTTSVYALKQVNILDKLLVFWKNREVARDVLNMIDLSRFQQNG